MSEGTRQSGGQGSGGGFAGGGGYSIGIAVDPATLAKVTADLAAIPQGLQRAVNRAVNTVGRKVYTQVLRAVSGEVNISQAELKKQRRGGPNVGLRLSTFETLRATVRISGRRVPLRRFGARPTRKGVSYSITRGGGRTSVPHVFLATMESGHVGVFGRRPGATRREAGNRWGITTLPIQELYGPSVPQVVENVDELSQEALDRTAGADLERELLRQTELLSQGKAMPK